MYTRLRKIWDALASSYWFVPVVMMLLAVILWMITGRLDHYLSTRDKKALAWLYLSDADTMRTVLLTIAAAIIGIVGVVFSIIMVPLSIAATQFGPRLLRTFLRDTATQVTLGTFNATLIFCMAVLLRLSSAAKQPLPQLSVNIALLLGVCSFAVLIYFINHIAVSLQAPVVVSRVARELHIAIRHDFPDGPSAPTPANSAGKPDSFPPVSDSVAILSDRSGYMQLRDDYALLHLACSHDILVELLAEPGDFVVKGQPLALAWGMQDLKGLTRRINGLCIVGIQRTLIQDVTFGVNELAEVAVRALSPAINDPFTAMTCLDWIASALCDVCQKTFPAPKLFDHSGALRVVRHPITFYKLADAAFTLIRENSKGNLVVNLKLVDTLERVARRTVSQEQRHILLEHAKAIESNWRLEPSDLNFSHPVLDRLQQFNLQFS